MIQKIVNFFSGSPTRKTIFYGGSSIGAAVLALVMSFEGLRTKAYKDPVGIVTICYGETKDVSMGDWKSPEECKALLLKRLPMYEAEVRKYVKRTDVPESVMGAMVSVTYNIGGSAFGRSSMAREMNKGNWRAACDALKMYVYAGKGKNKRKLKGLERRRAAEHKICVEGL